MLFVKSGSHRKNNPEYIEELNKAVHFFFKNKEQLSFKDVHDKFTALVPAHIDDAIMIHAHKIAAHRKEKQETRNVTYKAKMFDFSNNVPDYNEEEIEFLINSQS